MKRWIMAVASAIALLLIFAFVAVNGRIIFAHSPVLERNFVDLDDVREISKFRSCQGHLVVPSSGNEPKSNMKHYFEQVSMYDGTSDKLKVYAPFDGYVTDIRKPSTDNEGEIFIGTLKFPPFGQWNFILSHINVLPSIKKLDKVSAGQHIGYASFTRHPNAFDAIYARIRLPVAKIDGYHSPYAELDSVFNHMSDGVLAEYASKGASREDLIISPENRENEPCVYGNMPYFESGGKQKEEEWVKLKE